MQSMLHWHYTAPWVGVSTYFTAACCRSHAVHGINRLLRNNWLLCLHRRLWRLLLLSASVLALCALSVCLKAR